MAACAADVQTVSSRIWSEAARGGGAKYFFGRPDARRGAVRIEQAILSAPPHIFRGDRRDGAAVTVLRPWQAKSAFSP
jgi:hypothetical protein